MKQNGVVTDAKIVPDSLVTNGATHARVVDVHDRVMTSPLVLDVAGFIELDLIHHQLRVKPINNKQPTQYHRCQ